MVGDNRLESRLKILLKFKTNKIVLEPERYSGFYLDVLPDAARDGKGRGDVTLTGAHVLVELVTICLGHSGRFIYH